MDHSQKLQVNPDESKWIQVDPSEALPLPPILLSNFRWPYRYFRAFFLGGCLINTVNCTSESEQGVAALADEIAALEAGIKALDKSVAEATEQRTSRNMKIKEVGLLKGGPSKPHVAPPVF